MRIGWLAILGLAACVSPKAPTPWRHVPLYHIDSADDVRWPAERSMFVGTVRHHGSVIALELDDDPAGAQANPPLVALHGVPDELRAQLADGSRAAVSGIGRLVERDEAANGAVVSIENVEREPDVAAPHVSAYPLLRHKSDLSILLAQTYVTAEGVVAERAGALLLQLPSGEHLRLFVVACDDAAKPHVGKRRRVYGRLMAERDDTAASDVVPAMALVGPTFE